MKQLNFGHKRIIKYKIFQFYIFLESIKMICLDRKHLGNNPREFSWTIVPYHNKRFADYEESKNINPALIDPLADHENFTVVYYNDDNEKIIPENSTKPIQFLKRDPTPDYIFNNQIDYIMVMDIFCHFPWGRYSWKDIDRCVDELYTIMREFVFTEKYQQMVKRNEKFEMRPTYKIIPEN